MDLHIDLRRAIREALKDEIVVTNVEPAHVTAAADGGRPEIKSDMGSFIILAQSRSGSREGATPGSSKWLVVFDPLAQACQNSLKRTAVCEEAFSVSPRNSTASQRTLSAGFAVATFFQSVFFPQGLQKIFNKVVL